MSHEHEWFAECAHAEQPICQLLHAGKARAVPGLSHDERIGHQLRWLHAAAANGVCQAMMMLGKQAVDDGDGAAAAAGWLVRAVESCDHPDAHYLLAQLLLDGGLRPQTEEATAEGGAALAAALYHFEHAAAASHAFGQFNLGVARLFGLGATVDVDLAAALLEASGLPEGYQYLALIEKGMVRSGRRNLELAEQWAALAKRRGFGAPWRKRMRDHTGTGSVMNVALHSNWARHVREGQLVPPDTW